MNLPPAGREYATWTVTASEPGVDLEVTFDAGAVSYTHLTLPTNREV